MAVESSRKNGQLSLVLVSGLTPFFCCLYSQCTLLVSSSGRLSKSAKHDDVSRSRYDGAWLFVGDINLSRLAKCRLRTISNQASRGWWSKASLLTEGAGDRTSGALPFSLTGCRTSRMPALGDNLGEQRPCLRMGRCKCSGEMMSPVPVSVPVRSNVGIWRQGIPAEDFPLKPTACPAPLSLTALSDGLQSLVSEDRVLRSLALAMDGGGPYLVWIASNKDLETLTGDPSGDLIFSEGDAGDHKFHEVSPLCETVTDLGVPCSTGVSHPLRVNVGGMELIRRSIGTGQCVRASRMPCPLSILSETSPLRSDILARLDSVGDSGKTPGPSPQSSVWRSSRADELLVMAGGTSPQACRLAIAACREAPFSGMS